MAAKKMGLLILAALSAQLPALGSVAQAEAHPTGVADPAVTHPPGTGRGGSWPWTWKSPRETPPTRPFKMPYGLSSAVSTAWAS